MHTMATQPIYTVETTVDNTSVDSETEQKYKEIAIRRLFRKLDRRIIPFLCILEMGSYIIRTSIGEKSFIKILLHSQMLFFQDMRN